MIFHCLNLKDELIQNAKVSHYGVSGEKGEGDNPSPLIQPL
jgi:hypothetical protein